MIVVCEEFFISMDLLNGRSGGWLAFLVCVTFILYPITVPWETLAGSNCHVSLMAVLL